MKLESCKSNNLPLLKDRLKRVCNSYLMSVALASITASMLVFAGVANARNALTQTGQAQEKSAATEKIDKEKLDKVVTETKVQRPRKISKQPFLDLLAKVKLMKDLGDFDLRKPLAISVTASRSSDGALGDVTITQNTGDPKLGNIAKDFVAALRDSNALEFLEGTGALNLTAKLNKTDVAFTATSEAKSVARAAQLAKGYNALLAIGLTVKKGRDEEAVYKNAQVSSNGKQIIVKLILSRALAGQLLSKQLPSS